MSSSCVAKRRFASVWNLRFLVFYIAGSINKNHNVLLLKELYVYDEVLFQMRMGLCIGIYCYVGMVLHLGLRNVLDVGLKIAKMGEEAL